MRIELPVVVLNPIAPYNPVENAQVSVVDRDTNLTATVYATSSGASQRVQPLLTDAAGRVDGWVERGSYELSITIPGRPVYIEYFEAGPAGDESIDTDWIEDAAVTTNKIANDAITVDKIAVDAVTTTEISNSSVTTAKIANSAINTSKIATAAVTSDKLDTSTVAIVPLGTILDWFPPASASPPWTAALPPGYAVCDGTAWSSIPNDLGYSSGNIPNLTGRVTMGANASYSLGTAATHDSATAAQTPPGVGGNVGNNTISQSHNHTVPVHQHGMSHEHTVPSHNHYMAHSHGVNPHRHPIARKQANDGDGYLAYAPIYNETGDAGGSTDGGNRNYVDYSGDIGTTGVNKTITDQSSVLTTTGNPTGHWDNRALGVGVLKIMKVKNL